MIRALVLVLALAGVPAALAQPAPAPSASPPPASPMGAAQAQAVPDDPRIRTVPWQENRVIPLRGHLGFQTMIEFGPGERIENVSIGDSIAWQISPNRAATLLFVKPIERNAGTNMTVVTNLRRYTFELTSAEARGPRDPDIVFVLRFDYPVPPPPPPPPREEPPPPPPPEVLNFDYATTGSRRIAPQTVFDNGTLTFLRFPPGMEPPAIFVVGPDGSEGLANVRVNDDHVVVDTVAGELVLRLGRERAVVTNRGWRAPEGRTERRRGFWRD